MRACMHVLRPTAVVIAMHYIFTGEVGDWQNWFSPDQVSRMDEVYRDKMAGSSHTVRYTLHGTKASPCDTDKNMNIHTG